MPVVKDHPQSPTAQHEECSHRDKRVKTLAKHPEYSELTNSTGTDSTKTANLGQDQMGPASSQVAAARDDERLRYYIMPGDSTDATSAECTSASDSATRDRSGGNDDSMEEDAFKTFNFFGPKEIRDMILQLCLRLPGPLSTVDFCFLCVSEPCPPISASSDPESLRNHLEEYHALFEANKILRGEALGAFSNANVWQVLGANVNPRFPVHFISNYLVYSCLSLYTQLTINSLGMDIKHFFFQPSIASPSIVRANKLPADLDRRNRTAVREWTATQLQNPAAVVLSETEQCNSDHKHLYRFAQAQKDRSINPSTLTIKYSIHEPKVDLLPAEQCGQTFHITIKFTGANPRVPSNPCIVPWVAPTLDPEIQYEPKRHLLSPLKLLTDIQSISMLRTWSIFHTWQKADPADPTGETILEDEGMSYAYMQHEYGSVEEMLEHAGPDLKTWSGLGLDQAEISEYNIIEPVEDTGVVEGAFRIYM